MVQVKRLASNSLGRCGGKSGPADPAHIAIVKGLPRAVIRRRVDPAPARFQYVNDPADDPPIIDARLTARVRGQMRRDLRELLVRKPELVSIHPRFLSEALNHNPLVTPTTLWVQTLKWRCNSLMIWTSRAEQFRSAISIAFFQVWSRVNSRPSRSISDRTGSQAPLASQTFLLSRLLKRK